MSDEQKKKEEEVFDQPVSEEDLGAVSGGRDADEDNCVVSFSRDIYGGGGFPNCAATVEEGSWCWDNDACNESAVVYRGMHAYVTRPDGSKKYNCEKAWT